ncbi:hypothetical protein NUBL21991_12980 [Klebsiella pneumoniae]|nr:hypothetical protein NUBL21991_12980 [Klebsiella pneumoniae]
MCRVAAAPDLAYIRDMSAGPGKARASVSAAGQWQRVGRRFCAGWRLRLTWPTFVICLRAPVRPAQASALPGNGNG